MVFAICLSVIAIICLMPLPRLKLRKSARIPKLAGRLPVLSKQGGYLKVKWSKVKVTVSDAS